MRNKEKFVNPIRYIKNNFSSRPERMYSCTICFPPEVMERHNGLCKYKKNSIDTIQNIQILYKSQIILIKQKIYMKFCADSFKADKELDPVFLKNPTSLYHTLRYWQWKQQNNSLPMGRTKLQGNLATSFNFTCMLPLF